MKEITLSASAKINLSLDITGVREDGYHLMDMVMQSVGLADTVWLRRAADISVRVERGSLQVNGIPQGESNTAVRAARVFFEAAKIEGGCQIYIEKRIPQQAGMGGGSADAAAVLVGLNELYEAGLSRKTLMQLGLKVGADVPFCLHGGTARVQGIGEQVTPVVSMPDCHMVVIKPPFGISTADAFGRFDRVGVSRRPDNEGLLAAMARKNLAAMEPCMANVMEEAADFPQISLLRQKLKEQGASASLMTGSGSAVYGIFADGQAAFSAARELLGEGQSFLTVPVAEGVRILDKR